MEIFYGCCLTILEMTFILVGLLILHGLRKVLGATPFYIAAGVLLIFTQFAGATGLRMLIGYQSLDFPLSSSVWLWITSCVECSTSVYVCGTVRKRSAVR